MIYVYAIVSPGSDLDEETFEVQSFTREDAYHRAKAKLVATFVWASAERRLASSLRFVGAYPNVRAYQRAVGRS